MKAMILAAGFGTRLKPLTDSMPKALVPFNGKPMINYQAERLKAAGVTHIVVNAHYHSEKLQQYFKDNDLGIRVDVLHEDVILGTGGGILNAEKFFKDEPFFIVTNVDIDSDFNLEPMVSFHKAALPFATLGVQKRKTKRYIELDSNLILKGRATDHTPVEHQYAFNGIHIISGEIFKKGIEKGFSDILDIYIKLADSGERITGYDMGKATFRDMGKIEDYKLS